MTKAPVITYSEVADILAYDPSTGLLTWKRRGRDKFTSCQSFGTWNGRYAEKEAFTSRNGRGYKSGCIYGKHYAAHRICWLLHYGEWPTGPVDHINGTRDDNRIGNLRVVTHMENGRNQRLSVRNKSGVVGVRFDVKNDRWRAEIKVSGKNTHLGSFLDRESAITARLSAAREFGFHPNHGRDAP